MPDRFDAATRSRIMAAIRGRDTGPEVVVRRVAHALGFRFRLHGACGGAKLAGRPDLVFAARRKVVFVHGCFWHRHGCRHGRSTTATNADYWAAKFARNVERDRRAVRRLRRDGWGVMIVWECQTTAAGRGRVAARLRRFLG